MRVEAARASPRPGGNYASSLLPQQEAAAKGCDQVCFLDDVTERNLEELGGMNIMVVDHDGTVRTPHLTGTILEGSTRSAIIRLLIDSGRRVVEDTISLEGLLSDIEWASPRGLRLRDRCRGCAFGTTQGGGVRRDH